MQLKIHIESHLTMEKLLFWGWLCLSFFVVFLISGMAFTSKFLPKQKLFSVEVLLSITVGYSLAFYPILFLFLNQLGIKINVLLWVTIFATVGVWLGLSLVRQQIKFTKIFQLELLKQSISNWNYFLALLLVAISLFLLRFYAIRSLPLPMWGDSVHHTLIVQLLLDNGGLFESWQPYAEMESLTYHFGFHAIVAVFAMLSGLDSARATLIMGQFLNVFAVLSLAPLAWKISNGNRWATIVSWLFAGFISFMPTYYTNWGRYTQL
ncbi:MAG: hypothetical protein QXL34_06370 [Thermosphaera sp.]